MTALGTVSELPFKMKDSRLVGLDGSCPIHSILMAVHSSFLAEILNSISVDVETVFILPDYSITELETLCSVMYGQCQTGFVQKSLLKALRFASSSTVTISVPCASEDIVVYNGFLDGLTEVSDIIVPVCTELIPAGSTVVHNMETPAECDLESQIETESVTYSEGITENSISLARKQIGEDLGNTNHSCEFCGKIFKAKRY